MSGESSGRTSAGASAFERAFGEQARCNRCRAQVVDYRVVAIFLHDTVAVRAYCNLCYEAAVGGQYFAMGDGVVIGYAAYAERFGAPGPPPPPQTPVDAMLATLLRDGSLRALTPASEALARRQRRDPYRFEIEWAAEGHARRAELLLTRDGRVAGLTGDREACAPVERLIAASRR